MRMHVEAQSYSCPICFVAVEVIRTHPDEDHLSHPRDLSVCWECGSILMYDDQLRLCVPFDTELIDFAERNPHGFASLIAVQLFIRNGIAYRGRARLAPVQAEEEMLK